MNSLITRSRNTLVTQFLNTPGATHLLFIDADIAFEASQVYHMLSFDQDFVAGIYPLKVIDWSNRGDEAGGERGRDLPNRPAALRRHALRRQRARTRKAASRRASIAAAAFMLLKRQMIERMIAAYPESRYKSVHAYSNAKGDVNYALFECMIDKETNAYISEDFGFCQKWRDIGGKIWLDTEGKLTHVGAYNFQGDPRPRYLTAQDAPGAAEKPGFIAAALAAADPVC